jgi:hypothetical protein
VRSPDGRISSTPADKQVCGFGKFGFARHGYSAGLVLNSFTRKSCTSGKNLY